MKTLLLLRHAKSSWSEPGRRDFDRTLNERGLRAAPLVGAFMRERKLQPDIIFCSPAERAKRTASLVVEAAGWRVAPRYDERIYEADTSRLLEVLAGASAGAGVVLLVGHNPGMGELIARLTGEARRVPTAALACIVLEIENWSEASTLGGRLEWLVTPKELKPD